MRKVILTIVVLFSSVVVFAQNTLPKLPEPYMSQYLQMVIDADTTVNDSVRVWFAKIELKKRQNAAEKELDRRWNAIAHGLSAMENIKLIDSEKRAKWYSDRYVRMGVIADPITIASPFDSADVKADFRVAITKQKKDKEQITAIATVMAKKMIKESEKETNVILTSFNTALSNMNDRVDFISAKLDTTNLVVEMLNNKLSNQSGDICDLQSRVKRLEIAGYSKNKKSRKTARELLKNRINK